MRSLAWAVALGCGAAACSRGVPQPEPGRGTEARPAPASEPAAAGPETRDEATAPPIRPLRRCFPEQPTWSRAPVADLLDRAAEFFQADDAAGALACAEEATRQAPGSIEAQHDRGVALARLGRVEEARDAVTLLLALAPDDVEALAFAAEFYVNRLDPSSERARIGLELARRAGALLRRQGRGRRAAAGGHRALAGQLALIEAQALVDLGRPREALAALERAPARPASLEVRYQRAVAWFELGEFARAREALERVVQEAPDNASAHYHLALVLERDTATAARAEQHFARAADLEPESFALPIPVEPAEFADRVREAYARLPSELRAELARHGVRVETAELPDAADLGAEEPPLSPSILGLYRGLPIGYDDEVEQTASGRSPRVAGGWTVQRVARPAADESARLPRQTRTIVLFRRNLLRTVRTADELRQAIERTLLHEVGHVQGEDDASLRDRGLE